jgi:hypothetical protein
MKLEEGDKLFTLFWLDGKREVVVGKDIANAFSRAGYGGGARAALDWYDGGATDTHVYSHAEKTWMARPKRVQCSDMEALSPQSITLELSKALGLDFELPNKNQICIDVSLGEYPATSWVKQLQGEKFQTGCVRSIRVYSAHYCDGPYSEDGDEECHYMVGGTAWFDPTLIDQAIKYFLKLVKASIDRDAGRLGTDGYLDTFHTNQAFGGTSIDLLIENQTISDL